MKNNNPYMKDNKSFCKIFFLGIVLVAFAVACDSDKDKKSTSNTTQNTVANIAVPAFNADSAYLYVKQQVDFGYRIPNTVAHVKCGDYLVTQLKSYGAAVIEQNFQATAFDGTMLKSRNIIGSINPKATKRILLAAHWDSRPFAENDTVNKNKPIDGANDGASGVGVLLEVARAIQTSATKINVGIDIIFFDSEDYGYSEGMPGSNKADSWCLGSQYWAKNLHSPNYRAYYGILLDMVGAKDAVFAMEGTSMHYAPEVMKKVWDNAAKLGYGNIFINKLTNAITDDHSYVNNLAKIPMIDIVEYNDEENDYFAWYHHTHHDNMNVIDAKTLKAVGQTLLETIYYE
jgi:glutaminyl-peptide cyclotransferase